MKRRCKGGVNELPAYRHVNVRMSLDEFIEWALPRYEDFIEKYPDESPSISRFGDSGDYEIGNIELISLKDNRRIQNCDRGTRLQKDGSKRCSTCKTVYENAEQSFSKNKKNFDGYSGLCKQCAKESHNKWLNSKKTKYEH